MLRPDFFMEAPRGLMDIKQNWNGHNGRAAEAVALGRDGVDASEIQRILAERAAALARIPEETASSDAVDLLVFTIGREQYAVALDAIERIEPAPSVTPVPGAPNFWAGIINLRGRLYPVLDLSQVFGERSPGSADKNGGMLLLVRGGQLHVCLLVDGVVGAQSVLRGDIKRYVSRGVRSHDAIEALTPDLCGIINVEKLLSDEKFVVDQRVS